MHSVVLVYVGASMIGLAALAVSVLGTLRSRVSSYVLLVIFYSAFTIQVGTLFAREYLYLDPALFSYAGVFATYIVAVYLSLASLCAGALFYNRIFAFAAQRTMDAIVLGVAVVAAAAFAWPGAVTMDAGHARFIRHLPVTIGNLAYLALLGYLLAVGIAGPKADRPARELLLIWATFAFGVVGFTESTVQLVRSLWDPVVPMVPSGGGFLYSSIPYALYGVMLAYFFGSYLVADGRTPRIPDETIVHRFGISPREQEVIVLLNEGLGNREIAQKLCVSLATVKSHVHNIYEKTGAKGRYALFRLTSPADKRSA